MPARESRHVEQIYRTARTALRCGCVAFCVWCVGAAAAPFAGRSTSLLLQASLSALADFRFVFTMSLAGAAAGWAMVERVMRQKAVERLHARIKELETDIDPQRSTSGLTKRGKTNPADRLS